MDIYQVASAWSRQFEKGYRSAREWEVESDVTCLCQEIYPYVQKARQNGLNVAARRGAKGYHAQKRGQTGHMLSRLGLAVACSCSGGAVERRSVGLGRDGFLLGDPSLCNFKCGGLRFRADTATIAKVGPRRVVCREVPWGGRKRGEGPPGAESPMLEIMSTQN